MSTPKACILSVSGPRLLPDEAIFLAQQDPWAIILMGRSVETREQVRVLVDEIWAALGRACLIFIDQEGGRVRRMRPPEWPDFPAGAVYARLFEQSPELGLEACWLGHRLMATELQPMGVLADCAPVLDLLHADAHDIIGDRALGATPDQVAQLGRAALNGLRDGGVVGVIKHIPGHGRARLDSHEALPIVDAPLSDIVLDLEPFAALHDAPMAMTAHIAYQAFDPDVAATVSVKVVRDVIRGRIKFDGLLMSDDLGMKALGGALDDRARRSFEAGCDIALHCAGFEKDPEAILSEMRVVASACPRLSGKALARAEAAEGQTLLMQPFDAEAGWARFEQLQAIGREALA